MTYFLNIYLGRGNMPRVPTGIPLSDMHMGRNMSNIFDVLARRYIRDDPHWGSDLDFLKAAFEPRQTKSELSIRYLDIGCGPGFHVAAMKRFYPRATIYGIDFAPRMLREARAHLSQLGLVVELIETDILDFCTRSRYNIVSFLNNGLGNIYRNDEDPSTSRVHIVSKMRELLRKGGFLVLSVYNHKKLSTVYGGRFRILEKSDVNYGDLFVEYRRPGGRPVEYYSHWFKPNDIVHLLERDGFKVELLEERMARIVVLAKAV